MTRDKEIILSLVSFLLVMFKEDEKMRDYSLEIGLVKVVGIVLVVLVIVLF